MKLADESIALGIVGFLIGIAVAKAFLQRAFDAGYAKALDHAQEMGAYAKKLTGADPTIESIARRLRSEVRGGGE